MTERIATTPDDDDDETTELYDDLAYVETMLETAALTPTMRRVYALALRAAGGDRAGWNAVVRAAWEEAR